MLYKIVEAFSAAGLCDWIRESLDDGWTLHGNLLIHTDERPNEPHWPIYTQALIKEESSEELDARVNYFENLLQKPIDQLTTEERKERESYLEDLADMEALEAENQDA